jgi:bifunctional non-homologous end joining protein LigD
MSTLVPMLASPFEGTDLSKFLSAKDHSFELKLDGVRALSSGSRMSFRSGREASALFPEIVSSIATLPGAPTLDGEIVAFDEQGRPSFERLSRRLHSTRGAVGVPVVFIAFDVLEVQGTSTLNLSFLERRALLEECMRPAAAPLRLQTTFENGEALRLFCEQNDLEGIVRKANSAAYHAGPKRTKHWIKWKRTQEADYLAFAVVEGDTRKLGALDVASRREGELYYEGRVGSGFDDDALERLAEWVRTHRQPEYPVLGPEPDASVRIFIAPSHLVRVRFQGRSGRGLLRHAVFRGFREDIALEDAVFGD